VVSSSVVVVFGIGAIVENIEVIGTGVVEVR
jgi:hypothetical protein